MDKSDYKLISTVNGFEIRDHGRQYRVFHENFSGVYIADFNDYSEAKIFAEDENADEWAEKIKSV